MNSHPSHCIHFPFTALKNDKWFIVVADKLTKIEAAVVRLTRNLPTDVYSYFYAPMIINSSARDKQRLG